VWIFALLIWLFSITACSPISTLPTEQQPTEINSPILLPSSTPGAPPTNTATPTNSPTQTPVPSATSSPTVSPSPTITPTPTADVPRALALMRAFCRYGPGKAYLYSHELKEGDIALIDGRNYGSTWLWIQPANLERHCWVSASVVEVSGDLNTVNIVQTRLPQATLYGPPEEVEAERDGSRVVVSWSPVWMTVDDYRGYLIEATICQNGSLFTVAVQTDETSYEFTDEAGCAGSSEGRLYAVDKHGYTDPIDIPWP
jgi:hypothetical protein